VTLLAAKILLAPLCVVAVSLAGRRWGVAVAGLLGGLPVVAGPILLVETLLHGRGFGADAAVSGALGPHLSGLLAPFPIITSVLAVFTHAHSGVAQLNVLLRNFLLGFYGFAAFCFVLAIALPELPTAGAFGLATASALAVQATVFLVRSRYLRASRPVSAL